MFHMHNVFNHTIPFYRNVLLTCLLSLAVMPLRGQTIAQPDSFLSAEHSKLVVAPTKYLFSPQLDIITGASRVYRGDRSGIGFSITDKGIYQLSDFFHFNAGLGITVLNSRPSGSASPDSAHWANIIHTSVGFSFIIGDDRFQVVSTIDLLPSYYMGSSADITGPQRFAWGLSSEFGFQMRIRRYWYVGLTGKLQVFRRFDTNGFWPQYGLAGAGPTIRFSY